LLRFAKESSKTHIFWVRGSLLTVDRKEDASLAAIGERFAVSLFATGGLEATERGVTGETLTEIS
jgi:hypothetical protein